MKIALITIHNANNYGAVLQAYATKKILSKYGDVNTIDYDNKFLAQQLNFIRFTPSIHGVKMAIHDLLRLPSRVRVIKRFRTFIKENMNLTSKLSTDELMKGKAGEFDVYVCGSDQIWNFDIVGKDKISHSPYFLSFTPKNSKKISYASSMGHYIHSDEEKNEISILLQDFDLITCREKDGVEKLQELLPNNDIHHVLDPTLLLSKEEWLQALDIHLEEPKEKYILVYSVPRMDLTKKAIKYFANELNMKVVAIDQMLFPLAKVDEHIKDAGPKEFIELFANASFVITDSFHGTCFAINFGKPFVSISPGKKVNRISSLLNLLDIEERLVKNENDFCNICLEINTNSVFKNLNIHKKEYIQLLENRMLLN